MKTQQELTIKRREGTGKKPPTPKKAEKEKEKYTGANALAHVVVGLGNPGPEYRDTRHNIGQRVVEHLARQLKKAWHPDGRALVARGSWRGDTLYLVKPQSFMNVSGPSVRHVLHALGAGPEDLVLVYDDIDMALGKVRTRLRGSAGG